MVPRTSISENYSVASLFSTQGWVHLQDFDLSSPTMTPQPMSHHMHADFPCLVHSPLLRGGSSLIYSWLKSLPVPWWLPRGAVSIPSRLLPPPFSLTSGEFSELIATFQHCAKFQENGDDLRTKIQLSKLSQLQRERHTTRDCFHLQNKYMLRNLNFNVRAISSRGDFALRDGYTGLPASSSYWVWRQPCLTEAWDFLFCAHHTWFGWKWPLDTVSLMAQLSFKARLSSRRLVSLSFCLCHTVTQFEPVLNTNVWSRNHQHRYHLGAS